MAEGGGARDPPQAALAEAFKFDNAVVCERFIPIGREIRVAVVEDENGEPTTMLPATGELSAPHSIVRRTLSLPAMVCARRGHCAR